MSLISNLYKSVLPKTYGTSIMTGHANIQARFASSGRVRNARKRFQKMCFRRTLLKLERQANHRRFVEQSRKDALERKTQNRKRHQEKIEAARLKKESAQAEALSTSG